MTLNNEVLNFKKYVSIRTKQISESFTKYISVPTIKDIQEKVHQKILIASHEDIFTDLKQPTNIKIDEDK